MLRLTIDTPASLDESDAIEALADGVRLRQGVTLVMPTGVKLDVDLLNVDIVPEGRLIQ